MKFKPYPEYKDSGFEWIGEIPQEWDIIKIKFISDVIMGQSPKSEDYNFEGVGLPFLQGTAEFGEKSPDPIKYCNNANKFSEIGDILISVRAPVGETNLSNQKFAIGRGLAAIRTVEPLKSYLWYGVDLFKILFNYISSGSTYDAVSIDEVKSMVVSVPTKAEQEKITSFLDKKTSEIDLTIEKDTRLIELLKEKRTALINHVVTKGLDPTVKMKDSGVEWIGVIPEDWELRKISQSFDIIGSGTTPKSQDESYYDNGMIPWVLTGDLNDSTLHSTSKKITKKAFREYSTLKLYKRNSLIIAMYGATIGKISLLGLEACVNQACCVLADSKILGSKFVFYWFLGNKTSIISLSYGGGQPNISQDVIKTLKIQVPPIKEQEKIVSYLDQKTLKIDLTIQKIQEKINFLEEYKKSLIHHVVTGKVDVREVAV